MGGFRTRCGRPPLISIKLSSTHQVLKRMAGIVRACMILENTLLISGFPGRRSALPIFQQSVESPTSGQTINENFNSSLIRSELLGTSPVQPQSAFSLQSLESYRLMRLQKPSFSIQAFSQALSSRFGMVYTLGFRNRLSAAFDAYLAIIRLTDARVARALDRDPPHWRI